jgi:hypothetical protein
MDDNTVDRLFHMLLLDPLPKMSKKELGKWIGPNNLHEYDPVRVQLTAQLMKQHSENRKERELTKPTMVKDGRLILNDCSVHGFSYEEAKLKAHGEMDWNQHNQWACAFGQLSDKFEIARETLREISRDVDDWSHAESCDAWACDANECECPFRPELLDENDEIPDDHEYSKTDKNHVDCTCGKGDLQKKVDSALDRLGGHGP